jgi:hypothetical protein
MKNILHFLFALTIIVFMVLMLVPGIMIYMFTKHNIIEEIQLQAARLERKYFS